jgi:hypothetical protein
MDELSLTCTVGLQIAACGLPAVSWEGRPDVRMWVGSSIGRVVDHVVCIYVKTSFLHKLELQRPATHCVVHNWDFVKPRNYTFDRPAGEPQAARCANRVGTPYVCFFFWCTAGSMISRRIPRVHAYSRRVQVQGHHVSCAAVVPVLCTGQNGAPPCRFQVSRYFII